MITTNKTIFSSSQHEAPFFFESVSWRISPCHSAGLYMRWDLIRFPAVLFQRRERMSYEFFHFTDLTSSRLVSGIRNESATWSYKLKATWRNWISERIFGFLCFPNELILHWTQSLSDTPSDRPIPFSLHSMDSWLLGMKQGSERPARLDLRPWADLQWCWG